MVKYLCLTSRINTVLYMNIETCFLPSTSIALGLIVDDDRGSGLYGGESRCEECNIATYIFP